MAGRVVMAWVWRGVEGVVGKLRRGEESGRGRRRETSDGGGGEDCAYSSSGERQPNEQPPQVDEALRGDRCEQHEQQRPFLR